MDTLCTTQRDFYSFRVAGWQGVVESSSGSKVEKNVLFCGDLLRIVCVTSVRQLFGGFSFCWFLIVKVIVERRNSKFLKCCVNILVLFLIEKCLVQVS